MLNDLVLAIVGLNAFAFGLVVARGPVFHTRVYRPMLLNIGLSLAPLLVAGVSALALALAGLVGTWLVVTLAVLLGTVWLLLLPNAGYLVTELNMSHRREDEHVPMWYDIVLVISLAMSGVLNTVLNVFLVELVYVLTRYGDAAEPLRSPIPRLLVVAVLLLVAFGMYLGRYVRLNSWDVRHPPVLLRKVLRHLAVRANLGNAIGFTVLFAVFFGLIYLAVMGPMISALVALEEARR